MKLIKLSFIIAVAVLAIAGISTTSYAFHSGGVGECDGCHTMHNSEDNGAMYAGLPQYQAGPYLLQGSTLSEACLNCHQHTGDTGPSSYHISTADADMPAGIAPLQRTPGGDFGWLRKDYTFSVRGTSTTNEGAHRGHSIQAPAYGYSAIGTAAPGGTYAGTNLNCSSCHDPHSMWRRTDDSGTLVARTTGQSGLPIIASGSYATSKAPTTWGAVGVYRFLGGKNYTAKSTGYVFSNDAPIAIAPGTYNRSEGATDTHVAYGKGMAEWCANCHGAMLENGYTSGMSGLVHPAGNSAKMNATIVSNYNAYVKSGDMSGQGSNSYNSLIPFEEGTADITALKARAVIDGTQKGGPTAGTSNVMCLSCHRAHATGYQFMLRFPHENEFMTEADASGNPIYSTNVTISRGLSVSEQQAALYDRPATVFAPYQRLLCNKCHSKD